MTQGVFSLSKKRVS